MSKTPDPVTDPATEPGPENGEDKHRLVIITGMSGAGKSSAIQVLEDLGYEAVDNLPLSLLGRLMEKDSGHRDVAVDIDVRSRGFCADNLISEIEKLRERQDLDVTLLSMNCDDDVLHKRYTATRRRHPLAEDRPLMEGIRAERAEMNRVWLYADLSIDTSAMDLPAFRRWMTENFDLVSGRHLSVSVMSFSYRIGVPREADLVFDVRFLTNPFYDVNLRGGSGLDKPVADYIAQDPAFEEFFEKLKDLVLYTVPLYKREGKSYLTIAIGCTGGRHRSVFITDKLGQEVSDAGHNAIVFHRDMDLYNEH